jgi:hypothetical protein
MDALQQAIMNLGKGEDPISRQIEMKLKEKLTTALTDAVSDFDITSKKQQITTPEGKINTNEILKQGLDTLGRVAESWGSARGQQQVRTMPVPQQMPETGDVVQITPQAAPMPEPVQMEAPAFDPGPQPMSEPAPAVEVSIPEPPPVDRLSEKQAKKMKRLRGEE